MLKKKLNRLASYIHAGKEQNNFEITLLDCFKAFENAKIRRWFDPNTFNSKEYDNYCHVDEGDLNWIIPGQILAMASPSINRNEGMPSIVY
jgi:cell division cycle 14